MDQKQKDHASTIEQVLHHFKTDKKFGLSSDEANRRIKKWGFNQLSSKKKNQLILQVFHQFKDPIILILLCAMLITLLLKNIENTFAIFLVIALNTFLGFFQQWKASKSIEALSNYLAQSSIVIRDGLRQTLLSKEITLGDLIYLEAGQKVPADARLVETVNFTVDQSILTGESFPVEKEAIQKYPEDTLVNHQNNKVFAGTIVSTGRALAVITSIGDNTQIGMMSLELQEIDETPSPLQLRLKVFSRYLTFGIIGLISFIFIVGLLRGFEPFNLFLVSVSLIVSAIPEGLPLAVTLCLSSGIHIMAKHKAIVKRLSAVETFSACDVICSDKTGTMTSQQMTVNAIFIGSSYFEVTGHGYDPSGEVVGEVNLKKFGMIAAYTHECQIKFEHAKYTCVGDPTEGALVTLSKKIPTVEKIDGITFDIPFESERRWMAVTVDSQKEKAVYIKGATLSILNKCETALNEKGQVEKIQKDKIEEAEKTFAKKGYRVLALAYLDVDEPMQANLIDQSRSFTFAGLVAIFDPPRKEVYEAIKHCKEAKIDVKMITGDFPMTAEAIGEKIGLNEGKLKVVTGEDLEKASLLNRARMIQETNIFARVLPKHKVMIVSGLQEDGKVVAMTGDGVNDAASLKKADIGVAMGSGSDVAKEAASLVILDDNFSTIVEAIKQGRIIYENLQKMILYLITTAISGVGVLLMTTLLGWPLPLLPLQLLWINFVTDGTSTIPLALDKPSGQVLHKPPHEKNAPFISRLMVMKMILIGGYMSCGTIYLFYEYYYRLGLGIEKAQTIAFTTLALFQIWNVLCSRSIYETALVSIRKLKLKRVPLFSNRLLASLMGIAFILQIMAVEVPVVANFLKTVDLNLYEWIEVLSVSLSIFVISDLFKIGYAYRNKNG